MTDMGSVHIHKPWDSVDKDNNIMKDYIEGLIESIKTVFPQSKKIVIETFISEISLSSRLATSLGIIINELMTNIFKYAFNQQENGLVSISLEKNKTGIVLTVQDNGIGIDPEMITKKNLGFGLTIIKMLTEQLDGTLSLSNENGGKFGFQVPESGGTLWSDNALIPSTSKNKKNAETLLNNYYDPAVAAQVAAFVNYICPVVGAQAEMEKIDPELAKNPFIFPDEEALANVRVFRTLTPEEDTKYSEAFQAAAGN